MNKKTIVVPLVSLALIGGGALAGIASLAFAQTAETGSTTAAQSETSATLSAQKRVDVPGGGHVGANGVREEILTGATAESVKAAALAAYPGGTIERVETDAEGAAYEAHMTKADGAHITVKFDANYAVTATEGGPGGHGPRSSQDQ